MKKTALISPESYKCFQGIISNKITPSILTPIAVSEIPWDLLTNQYLQSWDHQINSLVNGPYDFYQALMSNLCIGYIGVNVNFKYLALFEIITGTRQHYHNLISGLADLIDAVKINNVEMGLTDKIWGLEVAGLKNTIDQYEMEMILK